MRRSFQSTLPRRERPRSQHKDAAYRNFNPRSREGSDGLVKCGFISINISIHAPAKGATIRLCNENDIKPISIHAPAKGATASAQQRQSSRQYFNPRSREGSDPFRLHPLSQGFYFNPRSREGSDWRTLRMHSGSSISIHAPAKGATVTAAR